MVDHSLTGSLPPRPLWPALQQPGHLQRCEAILEAIVWMTDGEDIPTAIELVYLGSLENWAAAHGDVDAIASYWALRALT